MIGGGTGGALGGWLAIQGPLALWMVGLAAAAGAVAGFVACSLIDGAPITV